MIKKGFTFILSLMILFSLSSSVFAAEGIDNGDLVRGISPQNTVTVSIPEEYYDVGETFIADIVVTSTENSSFVGFGLTLDYEKTELALVSLSTPLDGVWASNLENGKCGYSIYGEKAIDIAAGGVLIAQAEFKAIKAADAASIGVKAPEITFSNGEITPAPNVVKDSAKIYDITLTLVGGNSTFSGNVQTIYYAKYKETGLYSDGDRTQKVINLPVPTANAGYRLANYSGEKLWFDGTVSYLNNAEVLAAAWEESKTLTAQTVKTQRVTFSGGVNGSVAGSSFVVDKGKALTSAQLNSVSVTPNSGYKFDYWYLDDSNTPVNPTTVNINADTVFYAKFSLATVSYRVTFKAGDNGTVANNTFLVKEGATLTSEQLNSVMPVPNSGYSFSYWYLDDGNIKVSPADVVINADTVFYAKFFLSSLPLTDVPSGAWYYNSVAYCFNNGLMYGISDTEFGPENNINRGMVVTVLHRMVGAPKADYNMTFVDVPPNYYYTEAIRWAASEGIVAGYSEEYFLPEKNITRQEMVSIIWRYAGKPQAEPDASFYNYSDVGSVLDFALPAMKWAYANGIIKGTSSSTIAPNGNATRSQFAAIIERSIPLLK